MYNLEIKGNKRKEANVKSKEYIQILREELPSDKPTFPFQLQAWQQQLFKRKCLYSIRKHS